MPIVATKLREESPGRTAKGYYTSEQWEVWYDDGTGQYNESGLCDPLDCLNAPGGLPKYGDAHAVMGPTGATPLVVDVHVVQVIANWSYIVLVTYRGWGLFTGGPRAVSGSVGAAPDFEMPLPVFQAFSNAANTVTAYLYCPYPWERDGSVRIETRFVPGNTVTAIQNAIDANTGKWYAIGGRFMLLSGSRSGAWYDGLGSTRVSYAFSSKASHPGVALNNPRFNNAVAIPPINGLQGWQPVPSPGPGLPPQVLVVDYSDNASAGGVLPGYP